MKQRLPTFILVGFSLFLLVCLIVIAQFFPAQSVFADEPNFLYLPFIARCDVRQVVNGNFESGPGGWTEHWEATSPPQWEMIRNDSAVSAGVPPHGGKWVAWLYPGFGGFAGWYSYLEQRITVSPCTPYLSFWYYHEYAPPNDRGYPGCGSVEIWDVNFKGRILSLCTTSQWVRVVEDLSDFAGREITIRLWDKGSTYGPNVSNFIDDMEFLSSP